MSQYNLVDEAWIPVRDLHGNRLELGIRDVVAKASNLAAIEDPSPLVTAALHRFLLAVLYRAIEGPCDIDEARALFRDGLPKEKINEYLDHWHPKFYLLDEKYPFGQNRFVPDKEIEPWTKLALELNTGRSKVLFDHTDTTSTRASSNAHLARWIVTTMNFSVAGGRGYSPSPSADGIIAIPTGQSLEESLLLCLVPYPNREAASTDVAIWESEPKPLEYFKKKPERKSHGYADCYTWQARAVRLIVGNDGTCKDVAMIPGIRHARNYSTEGMIPTKVDNRRGVVAVQAEDRGIWREYDSLMPDTDGHGPGSVANALRLCKSAGRPTPRILVLAQSFTNAKVHFWRMEQYALPEALTSDRCIREDIHRFLDVAENAGKALEEACREYARHVLSRGERKPDNADKANFIKQVPVIPAFWSDLEREFHRMLVSFTMDAEPESIYRNWYASVKHSLCEAWRLLQSSVQANDAWAIRAFVKADTVLAKSMSKLKTQMGITEEAE